MKKRWIRFLAVLMILIGIVSFISILTYALSNSIVEVYERYALQDADLGTLGLSAVLLVGIGVYLLKEN